MLAIIIAFEVEARQFVSIRLEAPLSAARLDSPAPAVL
jgi:hypothetical protein